jgi:hypothetical protein
MAPAWLPNFAPAPSNSSSPMGTADGVALDVLFDDGEGRIVPEATAVWLVEVAATATGVEVSIWLVVSVVTVMLSEEDDSEEAVAEVSAAADPEEAAAEGLNVAVRPQSSAAAPTSSP